MKIINLKTLLQRIGNSTDAFFCSNRTRLSSPIYSIRKGKGFTLIETIVVIVILGTIMALAIPRYESATEAVRSREGVAILTSLLGAQNRYALENNTAFTGTLANLDVTIPTSPNFNSPTVSAAVNPADTAASIQRNGGSYGTYTLVIQRDGTVTCSGGSGAICGKIGY